MKILALEEELNNINNKKNTINSASKSKDVKEVKGKEIKGSSRPNSSKNKQLQLSYENDELINTPEILEESNSDEIIDENENLRNYYTSFELLNLSDKLRTLYNNKTEAIITDLNNDKERSKKLLIYLDKQHQIAREEEELEEDNLKRQGIIVGQHIPSLQSKLNINEDEVQQYGIYSEDLSIAKVLMEKNRIETLRRTGNMPISPSAESREIERANKLKATLDRSNKQFTTLKRT
eukprot:gene17489-23042_t